MHPTAADHVGNLLRFGAALSWADVPGSVQERVRQGVVDTVAVMLGGAGSPAAERARAVVAGTEGPGPASPVGVGLECSLLSAAWLTGVSGHALDYDDTHWPTILHASNPVLAAALAIATARPVTGQALAEAYLAGFEVAARVANSMPHQHYDRGWHVTGTVGGIGAAVAATRLLGGTVEQLRTAVSLAANQGNGHRQHFGSMAKPLNSANAARTGLVSALLSAEGFDADPAGIEGRRGMWQVMCERPDATALDRGLGEEWEYLRNGIKPYPCGVVSHPVIAAAEAAAARGFSPADVEAVSVRAHPLVVELTGKRELHSEHDVKFSVPTLVSLACHGKAQDVSAYSAHVVREMPGVMALAARVELAADGALGKEQARASFVLAGGRRITEEVTQAPGSPGNPIAWPRLEQKVRGLLVPLGHDERAVGELLAGWRAIDQHEDVGALLERVPRAPREVAVAGKDQS